VKLIADLPYVVFVTLLGAAGFLIGNLVFFQFSWQLVAAPIVGGLLGFLAGVLEVRSKKLTFFATMREHRTAMVDDANGAEHS
jgi:hypothetical protein